MYKEDQNKIRLVKNEGKEKKNKNGISWRVGIEKIFKWSKH